MRRGLIDGLIVYVLLMAIIVLLGGIGPVELWVALAISVLTAVISAIARKRRKGHSSSVT